MFDEASNAASTPVVPQAKFIVECLDLQEAPPFDPTKSTKNGIKWMLALYDPQTGQRFRFMDDDYVFWQTTTSNMNIGARARDYAEAFLGRAIAEGEKLNPSMLLGKRCIGSVIHEWSRNDKTKKVAKLVGTEAHREAVAASAPARSQAANGSATAVMERPSVAQVSADPSSADIDRALLLSSVEKKVKQAERLQTKRHLDWIAMDLSNMDADELDAIKAAVQQDIDAD